MDKFEDIKKIIQNLNENYFTQNLLIPLLKKMGYLKVEFYGGTDEKGKDIVIWKEDEWGKIRLSVGQVKHFKLTKKSSGKNSLSTIINQLYLGFNGLIPFDENQSYYPSEMILFSTYDVDSKILFSTLDPYPHLKDKPITIIDINTIVKFLELHYPEYKKIIGGPSWDLKNTACVNFSNNYLLKALNSSNNKNVETIYCDIDFSIGKNSTILFFQSDLKPSNLITEVLLSEWETVKSIFIKISKIYPLDFIEGDFYKIEENQNFVFEESKKINNSLENINQELLELKQKNYDLNFSLESLNKIIFEQKEILQKLYSEISSLNIKSEINYANNLENLKKVHKIQMDSSNLNNQKFTELNGNKTEIEKQIFILDQQKIKLEAKLNELKIRLSIKGKTLYSYIEDKKKFIEKNVELINKKEFTTNDLKQFLTICESIFEVSKIIYNPENKNIFKCLNINYELKNRTTFENTRIKLPIKFIFDTGLNISLFGEAGAGKSTSLEMYSYSKLNSPKSIVLVHLSKIPKFTKSENLSELDYFINQILGFLNNNGSTINFHEFIQLLNEGNCTILLDGIDEVIKIYPNLIDQIFEFSVKYPKVQLIISSRMHGNYSNKIPFLAFTLLPFTDEQISLFIQNWLKNEDIENGNYKNLISHLKQNKAVREIVRNPLLLTTLCVLAKHNIILPKTEIRLLEERMNLFTGFYDNIRTISRVNTSPKNLEKLSEKLAFYLHSNNLREEDSIILKEKSFRILQNVIDPIEIDKAFEELIHPCEILIPMSSDGKIGFGHLKFQEHLAAREILNNRSIDIVELIDKIWWKDCIFIFLLMNPKIDWLIKNIFEAGKINLPIVTDIINSRHSYERLQLKKLINDLNSTNIELIEDDSF